MGKLLGRSVARLAPICMCGAVGHPERQRAFHVIPIYFVFQILNPFSSVQKKQKKTKKKRAIIMASSPLL